MLLYVDINESLVCSKGKKINTVYMLLDEIVFKIQVKHLIALPPSG